MYEIRREALVKAPDTFVPPSLGDAVPGALIGAVLVLQSGTNHLVRVSGTGSDQLRDRGECKILD